MTARQWPWATPSARYALMGALPCALMAFGCAAADETTSAPEQRTELSRDLDPEVVVTDDADIGASIGELVSAAAHGSDASYSPTVANCVMSHYELDGLVIAVDEHCIGSHRKLYAYRPIGDQAATGGDLWRVFGDSNDDDRVDAWFDPAGGGLLIHDRNHDAMVDTSSEAFERVGDEFVIEGYEPGWTPPAYPKERILSDSDFDGAYDRETITAGEDPDGNPSYWLGPPF